MTRKPPFILLAQEGQPGLTPQLASPRPPSTLGLLEVEERGLDTDLGFNPGGHGAGCPSTRFNMSWASLLIWEMRAARIYSQRRGRLKTQPRIDSLQPPYRPGPEKALGPWKLKVTPGLGHSPVPQHVVVPLCSRSAPAQHGEEITAPSATTTITALTSPPSCWGHCTRCMGHTAAQGKGTATQTLRELNVIPCPSQAQGALLGWGEHGMEKRDEASLEKPLSLFGYITS